MAYAASVDTVLEKITRHNSDVLGGIAAADGEVFSNLPETYELNDLEGLIERATNIFQVTDELGTGQAGFDQAFLEFSGHSFYARRMSYGVLILLNKPIQRRHFKKMQVGVNLFLKPLERALRAATGATEAPETVDAVIEPLPRNSHPLRRVFGSLV